NGGEISFEASVFFCALVDVFKPNIIYDLGSGWSSFLWRWKCPDAIITSVDDDDDWMKKSIEFCRMQNVSTTGFIHWTEFSKIDNRHTGDLVLHDLGRRPLRVSSMKYAVDLVSDNGILI